MKCTNSWNALMAVLLLACAAGTARAQTFTRFLVSPIVMRLDVNASGQIQVELLDARSRTIPAEEAGVQFISSDTTIVIVSATGAVRALQTGRAEIEVKAGLQSRRVPVTVLPGRTPVAAAKPAPGTTAQLPSVAASGPTVIGATIQPINIQLLPGERFRPSFQVIYADGTQAEARDVVWSTFGPAIALDPNANEVIGVVPGAGTLGGRYGKSITHSVPVSVGESVLVPKPDSLLLASGVQDTVLLIAPGQGGRAVTQNLIWRTTDPEVLRVLSPTEGVVQALNAGDADLIVDGYGVTRRIPVRVTPRIARIETIPAQGAPVTVGTGGSVTIEAKPIGALGTVLSTSTLTWRVADTTLVRIDNRGTLTGLRAGTTRATLDAPGMETVSWPVTIQSARVAFGLEATSVIVGTKRKLAAQIRTRDQRDFGSVSSSSSRWISSAPEVATVDASGSVTAIKPGRATIVASQPGAGADTVTVFVTGRGLVSGTIDGIRGIWQLIGANDTTPVLLAKIDSAEVSQAVWSPDRTKIALTYEPLGKGSVPRVVVIDADGRNWRTISPDTVSASDPAWTPDGQSVLMATRDQKRSAILRVRIDDRETTVLALGAESQFRYPSADVDSTSILMRVEMRGTVDLARLKAGTITMLTNGKPREELIARLRDGRVLLAVDSSSRSRPGTLQWVTIGIDQVQTPTEVRVPPNLVIVDISPGYDDATVIVVARAKSWPGASRSPLVVLRIALDGADPQVMMILGEKDAVTVRSD